MKKYLITSFFLSLALLAGPVLAATTKVPAKSKKVVVVQAKKVVKKPVKKATKTFVYKGKRYIIDENPFVSCTNSACFEPYFQACTVGKDLQAELGPTIAYYYKIVGLKDGRCSVTSNFIKNPNKNFVGKDMTCEYDHTLPFDAATQDLSTCKGPLADLLKTSQ